MKKSSFIIFFTVITVSMITYGFKSQINTNVNRCEITTSPKANPDFVYLIEPRFNSTISKKELQNAKSITDIFPKKATNGISDFQNTKIVLLPENKNNTEYGKGEILNPDQLALISLAEYSTNFYLRADYTRKTLNNFQVERNHIIYYMSVIPEKPAEYQNGHSSLINYLKQNSVEETLISSKNDLKPGKIRFTVTQQGEISDVILESTSGHQVIDQTMLNLISKAPGKWNPATNEDGKAVEQDLTFFFGVAGC